METDGDSLGDANERNIISGNIDFGVWASPATSSIIAGNLIGSDATGNAIIASGQAGVVLTTGSTLNRIGSDGNGVSDSLERNIIVGSTAGIGLKDFGVQISGAGTTLNVVAGNYIGVGQDGLTGLGNGKGVFIDGGASSNTIGGNSTALRNVISGNAISAVSILGVGTNSNSVMGNYIGLGTDGNTVIANSFSGAAGNCYWNCERCLEQHHRRFRFGCG